MALYICYFCANEKGIPGVVFDADTPVCPVCKADRKNPRHASRVLDVTIVHFHPPSAHENIGVGHLACTPDEPFPGPKGKMGTGETHVVNCPACKKTDVYQHVHIGVVSPVVPENEDYIFQPAPSAAARDKRTAGRL